MKKFMTVLVTLVFSLSLTAVAFGQETGGPAKTGPQAEQQKAAPKKKAQKAAKKKTKKKKAKKSAKKPKTAKKTPAPTPGAEGTQ